MYLKRLVLKSFRNYSDLDLEFSPLVNFIVGDNGSGKTNILEAISLTSTLRSFRNILDNEIIQWGKEYYFCSSQVNNSEDSLFEVGCGFQAGKLRKRIKIDGAEIKTITDYYGRFQTVVFAPSDINIINGAPDLRRRFTDSVISKNDNQYLHDLSEFRKILVSRNRYLKILKEHKSSDIRELEVWDKMFSVKAANIINTRELFFKNLNELFIQAYNELSGENDAPEIFYSSTIVNTDHDQIIKQLNQCRNRDIILGSTGIGPQRDDFIIRNRNKVSFVNYASQGQRRLAAICLKISESECIEKTTGLKAVLLVDDIFSELDKKRRKNMLDVLTQGNQIIFTMVHRDIADSVDFKASKIFCVESPGNVSDLPG
ncbi:MAG TPA: DNA replication/repair protein RecF [Spirochaetota bacterium]|nr:DNA replication/repair protein RecF [Spirochaetota bacterium]HPI88373.1 DNA replication/repair protein RecF [Spirochaetota bacterium]HPR46769.1 DNA replication/repair protein RecF [Spirochaetota bacterium]